MGKAIIIDPGHGGLINGVYQTAPKKMYDHGNGNVAYEGVINRLVASRLKSVLALEGVPLINLCPTNLDVPLQQRVAIANVYVDYYGAHNILGISLHSNAGGGHGFEIFTSPGETASDAYATKFVDMFKEAFPEWRIRKDLADGDPDKEAAFYILKHTKCPWILPEWGFFDNMDDWEIINNPREQLRYAEMIADFVLDIV